MELTARDRTGDAIRALMDLAPKTARRVGENGDEDVPLDQVQTGDKLRVRPESFADHYTQARMFWKSLTDYEQRHVIGGFG